MARICFFRCGGWCESRLLRVHPVGGLLGLGRSGEQGAGVVLQDAQPRRKVGGMVGTRMVGNAEIGKHKATEDLHAAFFRRVSN